MTPPPPRQRIESGDGGLLQLSRFSTLGLSIFGLALATLLPMSWPEQAVLAACTILLALAINRIRRSYLVTLALTLASVCVTLRYGLWRVSTTIDFLAVHRSPWNRLGNKLDAAFILLLLLAELYAILTLLLGYAQMLWPLRRRPVPLPADPADWPTVDVLIPTINESLSIVRHTALACMNMDWPADKLNVYVLDDGRRVEFRDFCEEAGIGYMSRDNNRNAKAGNLNHALTRLNAPLVAVFDCDHVPTRSFLQLTTGWFLRDEKLGMLQTPHHFYSPDPFDRNLNQFRIVPNEAELFHSVVQDGNDFWNATFFCGSCAVLRRSALDQVGGVATETVAEDAHTSLRMQRRGWNSAYINIPQAAGLAAERLSSHIRQRMRWAEGMVQILRLENPLFASGLKLSQRICYFNAMAHFLYALPRLVFLFAPVIYLLFGRTSLPGYWAAILAYALPHLILARIVNARIHGRYRQAFWNEIYETVFAPYLLWPTLRAIFRPRAAGFPVTTKGSVVERRFFDAHSARPFLFLIALNLLGLLLAIPRYWHIPVRLLDRLFDRSHTGAIALNVLWCGFNLLILGVVTAVAWESRQRRRAVRMTTAMAADVVLSDGTAIEGATVDISSGGAMIRLDPHTPLPPGKLIRLVFPLFEGEGSIPAAVLGYTGGVLRARFGKLTLEEEEVLTMLLYSRADAWLNDEDNFELDRPMHSIQRILRLSLRGLRETLLRRNKPTEDSTDSNDIDEMRPPRTERRNLATSLLPLLLIALFTSLASAQPTPQPASQSASQPASQPTPQSTPRTISPTPDAPTPTPTNQFTSRFSLADAGIPHILNLRSNNTAHSIHFPLPQTEVVKSATLHLHYQVAPAQAPALSYLKVTLNGTRLPIPQPTSSNTDDTPAPTGLQSVDIPIPAELLVHENELTFELVNRNPVPCDDPSRALAWAQVESDSTLQLAGILLPLRSDLSLLPAPFYEPSVAQPTPIPIVFLRPPSDAALEAAGILASWLGIVSNHTLQFSVTTGNIPTGNAIVLAERPSDLRAALDLTVPFGPALSLYPNPTEAFSKILLLSGNNGEDVRKAAIALVIGHGILQGDQVSVSTLQLPPSPIPDSAAPWLSTRHNTAFGALLTTAELQSNGATPIELKLNLPPDLYLAGRTELKLHLRYRYNSIPLADNSSLQVFLNGAFIGSASLPHSDKPSAPLELVLPVPVSALRSFANTLTVKFAFHPARRTTCEDPSTDSSDNTNTADTLQGVLEKDSYLDLHGIPNWTALPNLNLFQTAGYPFTRKADLSDTAVVLPKAPTSDEIELFLGLMSRFGTQTGYPALNIRVTNADGMGMSGTKDYLVLGTPGDQPAFARLGPALPVRMDQNGLHIQSPEGLFAKFANTDRLFANADRFLAPIQRLWRRLHHWPEPQPAQLAFTGGSPDALVEGLEWPRHSARSVVVFSLRDHAVAPALLAALASQAAPSELAHSVSVLRGQEFTSYQLGRRPYFVGALSHVARLRILFAESPWLVVLAAAFLCLIAALALRSLLGRHARARLQGER